jgi:hypothetical protein
MPAFADGSGILLCPVGEGFSTISDLQYELIVQSETYGLVVIDEIDVAVFQEWVSNAKELTVTKSFTYTGAGSPEDSESSVKFMQKRVDGEGGFNKTDHPFPLNEFFEVLRYSAMNSGEYPTGNPDLLFRYEFVEGDSSNPEDNLYGSLEYPAIFIRNDKFYWVRRVYAEGVQTLSTTELKLVEKYDTENFDPATDELVSGTITVTDTVAITERFY